MSRWEQFKNNIDQQLYVKLAAVSKEWSDRRKTYDLVKLELTTIIEICFAIELPVYWISLINKYNDNIIRI